MKTREEMKLTLEAGFPLTVTEQRLLYCLAYPEDQLRLFSRCETCGGTGCIRCYAIGGSFTFMGGDLGNAD